MNDTQGYRSGSLEKQGRCKAAVMVRGAQIRQSSSQPTTRQTNSEEAMKYTLPTCFGSLVAAGIILSGVTAHAQPFADVSNWVGLRNTLAGNNYLVTGTTSAGGTLMERTNDGAYLADLTLEGGPITGSYEAYGSLTFDAKVNSGTTVVDPVVLIGFFDQNNLAAGGATAGGFNFADSSLTAFRLQTGAQTSPNPVVPEGSYEFRMEYDTPWSTDGTFRAAFYTSGADVFTANPLYDIESAGRAATTLNAFGIFQPDTTRDSGQLFSVTLDNLSYTGMTAVPEPVAAALLGLGVGSVLLARRHTRRARSRALSQRVPG